MKKAILLAVIVLLVLLILFFIKPIRRAEEKKKAVEMVLDLVPTNVTLLVVYDNYEYDQELSTGFGFSCVIKTEDKTILFDTDSDGETLLNNMEKLGIKPKAIDVVVLSHIHFDHVGGLTSFLEKNSNVTVYVPASFPDSFKNRIKKEGAKLVDVSAARKITESVGTTGELGTWIKEQSLIVRSRKGIVVITGCAHPGIVNILKRVKELTNENIYLVLGGFHHPPTSVVKEFKKLGVQKVAPCHCTGDTAIKAFAQEYGDDYIKNGVGKIIKIK